MQQPIASSDSEFARPWHFQREKFLEDFVWEQLEALLSLKPLVRQRYLNNQVCDILAVDSQGQLTIVELKNTEDRYIVQQLTRYYDAVLTEKPFSEQVSFDLPIRLMAIAPSFHPHNFIDQTYSRLTIEFYTWRVVAQQPVFQFELKSLEQGEARAVLIPSTFHPFLTQESVEPVIELPQPSLPPKSLTRLIATLSPDQQAYLLSLRAQLLAADPRMMELGKTTTTQYGLRKSDREIYQTKLCAEFLPVTPGDNRPRLCLRLPYPKREMGGRGHMMKQERVKGIAWVEVNHVRFWEPTSAIQVVLYLQKGRSRTSKVWTVETYREMYCHLTRRDRTFQTLSDLVALAIEEWLLLS